MRHNAATIVEAIGLEAIATDAKLPPLRVSSLLGEIARDVERLPRDADEIALDQALVCAAVQKAVDPPLRHHRHRLYGDRTGHGATRQRPVRARRRHRHRRCARAQPRSLRRPAKDARYFRRAPVVAAAATRGSCSTANTCCTHAASSARSSRRPRSSSRWPTWNRSTARPAMNAPAAPEAPAPAAFRGTHRGRRVRRNAQGRTWRAGRRAPMSTSTRPSHCIGACRGTSSSAG